MQKNMLSWTGGYLHLLSPHLAGERHWSHPALGLDPKSLEGSISVLLLTSSVQSSYLSATYVFCYYCCNMYSTQDWWHCPDFLLTVSFKNFLHAGIIYSAENNVTKSDCTSCKISISLKRAPLPQAHSTLHSFSSRGRIIVLQAQTSKEN